MFLRLLHVRGSGLLDDVDVPVLEVKFRRRDPVPRASELIHSASLFRAKVISLTWPTIGLAQEALLLAFMAEGMIVENAGDRFLLYCRN